MEDKFRAAGARKMFYLLFNKGGVTDYINFNENKEMKKWLVLSHFNESFNEDPELYEECLSMLRKNFLTRAYHKSVQEVVKEIF